MYQPVQLINKFLCQIVTEIKWHIKWGNWWQSFLTIWFNWRNDESIWLKITCSFYIKQLFFVSTKNYLKIFFWCLRTFCQISFFFRPVEKNSSRRFNVESVYKSSKLGCIWDNTHPLNEIYCRKDVYLWPGSPWAEIWWHYYVSTYT